MEVESSASKARLHEENTVFQRAQQKTFTMRVNTRQITTQVNNNDTHIQRLNGSF